MSSPSLVFFFPFQPGFYKGVAGSQVTLSSLVNQSRAMLEEQARHLLTEAERQTMGYYVEEYRDGHIGVEQLVVALFELLNTHAKVKAEEACLRKQRKRSKRRQFSLGRTVFSCTVCVCDCCEI